MEGNLVTFEFLYKGAFAPNPLVYFDPLKTSIDDVDFSSMEFNEFKAFVQTLTRERKIQMYYLIDCDDLLRLKPVHNEEDFAELIETTYEVRKEVKVYVDSYNEQIVDWIEAQKKAEAEKSDESEVEDDVDSTLSNDLSVDHEADDEVIPIRNSGNPLLTRRKHVPFIPQQEDDAATSPFVFPVHDPTQEWNTLVPILGMRFSDHEELKHMLSNYAVANGYKLWYEKCDKNRLLVFCSKTNKRPKCPFRLWATWMPKERSFQIKSLIDEHNCSRSFSVGSMVTYKWIAKHFLSEILENPKMSSRKMVVEMSKKFNLKVSKGQCRNAKKFAMEEIEGSLVEHYGKLWSYAEEIRRSNPDSTVKLSVDVMPNSTTHFSRFYVCFKGLKYGWIEGCRKVIGIDGCFLKGICKGELLSAVGRDANNHMFPLAWAVVGVENKETWKWFIDLLLDDINMGNGDGLTLISDQHKGLVEAVKERAPMAEHRQCARHIYANFKKRFTGVHFRKLFWMAAKSTIVPRFQSIINEIKQIEPLAYDHLMERDPKSWSKAYFKVDMCCDAIENGISESFNAAIVESRKKPIITMLEEIRIWVMERIYKQQMKCENWDLNICPSVRRKLETAKQQQRFWGITPSSFNQFEVRLGQEAYGVDLDKRTCACRGWQLTGIPCLHVVAATSFLNLNPEDYVALYFSTHMFQNCYAHTIKPLNGIEMWPEVPYLKPLPPKKRRLPGRPTVKRKIAASEREGRHTISKVGSVLKCSLCKRSGHNIRKCPTNPVAQKKNAKKPASKRPVEEATVGETPVEEAIVGDATVGEATIGEAHVGEAPAPVEEAIVGDAPVVEAPVREAHVGEAPAPETAKKMKLRRPSERIMKMKLGNKTGESSQVILE